MCRTADVAPPSRSEEIGQALRLLYSDGAAFKSKEQELATATIVAGDRNVVAVIVTGGGKTLLMLIPTLHRRDKVTLVVVQAPRHLTLLTQLLLLAVRGSACDPAPVDRL